ncbi:alpha/beta fold hydrolase [Nonomuraea sp. KM90]
MSRCTPSTASPIPKTQAACSRSATNPRVSLYGDLPDEEAEQAVSKLVNQTIRSFAEKVDVAAWRSIPSTYIITEQDQAVPLALQEQMAAQAAETRRLPGGHSPFLSRPRRLATLIDEIVRSA